MCYTYIYVIQLLMNYHYYYYLIRFATSWIETRDPAERANLTILFDKYVPSLVEVTKSRFKKITPLPEICHVEMLCKLLDYFLIKENVTPDCPKEWYK